MSRPLLVGPLPDRVRHRFPIFERRIYINSCSQGALSDAVRDAYARYLDDWDEKKDRWKSSGAEWARRLNVSPSTIYMLRRGETWEHLGHPNQGRKPKKKAKKGR